MDGIDLSGLQELAASFDKLLDTAPKLRRELHQDISQMLKEEVDTSIAGRVNDSQGHVRSWQRLHVGSGGGYAAVRPARGEVRKGSKSYRMGELTAYLEHGHIPRPPAHLLGGPKNPRYKSRLKVLCVPGRFFYQSAGSGIAGKAIAKAEAFAARLGSLLEGGGS